MVSKTIKLQLDIIKTSLQSMYICITLQTESRTGCLDILNVDHLKQSIIVPGIKRTSIEFIEF